MAITAKVRVQQLWTHSSRYLSGKVLFNGTNWHRGRRVPKARKRRWTKFVSVGNSPLKWKCLTPQRANNPKAISKEFTLSMHEKSTLRRFWLHGGQGVLEEEASAFDITKLLGFLVCFLLFHTRKTRPSKVYDKIASISTVMKGMTPPPQINPNFEFTFDPFDQAKFDSLPDFLKDKSDSQMNIRHFPPNVREMESAHAPNRKANDPEELPFWYGNCSTKSRLATENGKWYGGPLGTPYH